MASPILLGAPYVPPPAPSAAVSPWRGISMTWQGWDGSEWALTDDTGGVYLPRGGVRGLSHPRSQHYTSDAAGVSGERVRGSRRLPRDNVFWPLEIYTDAGSQAWLDLDSAFHASLSDELPGIWTVRQPGAAAGVEGSAPGRVRHLEIYFIDDDDHVFEIDRSVVGWEVYGLKFRAPSPYWRGDPIVRGPWGEAAGEDFIDPETGAPPVYISESQTAVTASMPNPGQYPAYPTWRISGTDGVSVGVGGDHITIPFAVGDDDLVEIDTEGQVVYYNGEDITAEVPEFDPAPVPPGRAVDLDVLITGTGVGQVSASLVPLYRRAW